MAESVAVPLIQVPSVGYDRNLAWVPAITHLLLVKDTVGSLMPTNTVPGLSFGAGQHGRRDIQFNVNPKDSTHIDESPCL